MGISTLLLSFFLVKEIQHRSLKRILIFLQVTVIVLTVFFYFVINPSFNERGSWETVWITHRLKEDPKIYVAQQMLDIGARGYARRIVKVIPLTPLFAWVTPFDTTTLNGSWTKVNEDYNPFNWK